LEDLDDAACAAEMAYEDESDGSGDPWGREASNSEGSSEDASNKDSGEDENPEGMESDEDAEALKWRETKEETEQKNNSILG